MVASRHIPDTSTVMWLPWQRHIEHLAVIVHKVLTLTAKKRDQRGLQNSDKNKLVEIKVKLEAN